MEKINSDKGKVSEVLTNRGPVKCGAFVNCAGFWARALGALSDPPVKIPLHPVEHYYLHTRPIPGLSPNMPG